MLILMASTGCATTKVLETGKVGSSPLVTVEHATPERVTEFCGTETALGCELTRRDQAGVWRTRIIARIGLTAEETAAVLAHETCHALAKVNMGTGAIPRDPCHDQNGGVFARSTHEERVRGVTR